MAPTVSVIIPTFNRGDLVIEAIDSVLSQRGPTFEVIVVDDGSTDGTWSRVRSAAEVVRYLRQEHRGVSAARNHGARVARGEWLAFLDSDDYWLPGKLAAQAALHARDVELSISHTAEMWTRNGRRVNACDHHRPVRGDFFIPSIARCMVSPSAVMLRRDLFESLGGFDESLSVCEDYDLWLRIAQRHRIGLDPRMLVVKRGGHADQLSRQHWGMDRFRVAALSRLLAENQLDAERRSAVIAAVTQKCTILANGAKRRERAEEASRYLALAQACAGV